MKTSISKIALTLVMICSIAGLVAALGNAYIWYEAPVRITQTEGMQVVDFSIDEAINPGATVTQNISLTNSGTQDYSVTLDLNSTLPEGWTSNLPVTIVMPSGTGYSYMANITTPGNSSVQNWTSSILIGRE